MFWSAVVITVAVFFTACVCAGCAGNRTDLVASGAVTVEPSINRSLRSSPEVYEKGGDMVVSGRVERNSFAGVGGCVAVTVTAPNGAVVYDAQVEHGGATSCSPGATGPRYASFHTVGRRAAVHGEYSVQFPGLPPKGSIVGVKHELAPQSKPAGE